MSCHVMSYHIISYHIISYHIISYHMNFLHKDVQILSVTEAEYIFVSPVTFWSTSTNASCLTLPLPKWHMERKMYIGHSRKFSCFEWSNCRVFPSCFTNKLQPDAPPDTMPAWCLSPRVAEVWQSMMGATEMMVLVLTFVKSNSNSLKR
jgi:hypothetical protein